MTSSGNKKYWLEERMPQIRQTLDAGRSLAIGPKGTSMRPLIRQGIDYVELAALPEKLSKYDIALYQRPNGQYVLHRIVKTGDTYTCIGDNQFQKEIGVQPAWMIARVTAVYRGEKRVSVDAFSYKVYCRLWHWSRPVRKIFWRAKDGLRRRLKK